MRYIEELRKCDPSSALRAPTLEATPGREWVFTPIGQFVAAWDALEAERDRYKEQVEFWKRIVREFQVEASG